jgi:hypothetical protein
VKVERRDDHEAQTTMQFSGRFSEMNEQALLQALQSERRFLARQEIFKQLWRLRQRQESSRVAEAAEPAARESDKPARGNGRNAAGGRPPSLSARSA